MSWQIVTWGGFLWEKQQDNQEQQVVQGGLEGEMASPGYGAVNRTNIVTPLDNCADFKGPQYLATPD